MWLYFLCCFASVSGWIVSEETSMSQNATVDEAQPRISGGEQSELYEHPYQVQLQDTRGAHCSGAIISNRYILTAAHCVRQRKARDITARVGHNRRDKGNVVRISKVFWHPGYNNPENDKDIGILKTAEKLNFNRRVQPVQLPDTNDDYLNNDFLVSGWGHNSRDSEGRLTHELNHVRLSLMSNLQCQTEYPLRPITSNMFCAADRHGGGRGACKGDGGAPAVQGNRLYGISTFTRSCGHDMGPSVFTRMSAPIIRNFITEHTGL